MSVTASVAPPPAPAAPSAAAAAARRSRRPGRRALVLVLVAIVSAATAFAATTLVRGHAAPRPGLAPGVPTVLSIPDVAAVAKAVGHPVYGAGAQPGTRLEVTRSASGETWVRYLTAAARPGDPRAGFLTVGTYRQPGALAAAQKAAKGARTKSAAIPGGGLMLWSLDRPTSVYVAKPASDLLIEVYSPDAGQAQGLARGGAILPLG